MRPPDAAEAERLSAALSEYEDAHGVLPGIVAAENRTSFIEQVVESERRRRFVRQLATLDLSPLRADPTSVLFDPLKAAVIRQRMGQVDEAFWMVFLFVQFGRSRNGGWRYTRDVYGRLGSALWDWRSVAADPGGFATWLVENASAIRANGQGGFGNHRKYERLETTGEVVESYVAWVGPEGSHAVRFAPDGAGGGDPRRAFAHLYASMAGITRFGRTARFDYLTTVGRLGLAEIEPDRPYLGGATGPLKGARLLFGSTASPHELDGALQRLGQALDLAMDVVEDGVCNWQKSPGQFRPFRG